MKKIAELRGLSARMQEGRVLCEQVVERMAYVLTLFQARRVETARNASRQSSNSFGIALDYFQQILVQFLDPPKSPLKRIAAHQSIADEVRRTHEALDEILRLLGENMTPEEWQQKMEDARVQQQQQLKQTLDQTRLTESDRELIDEVLKMFKSATVVKHALQTLSPSDLEWMQTMYFKLFRLARSLPVDEPEWLIPSDNVAMDDTRPIINLGPCGKVYSGTWGRGTRVTIRVLQANNIPIVLMMKEANLWYRFNHPHILKLFGACHKGDPFFVCEDALQGHLGDFVGRPQNQHKVWRALYETSLGLYYLHSQRIAHGDLRCQNIRIGVDSKAKLCNFYYSVKRDDIVVPEEKSVLHSTTGVQWKSPEYLDGSLPTLASDIFSFGMCIIEAVTGKNPWGNIADNSIRQQLLDGRLPMQPNELKNESWRLVQRMCSFDPKARPSIITVVDDLHVMMREEATQTVAPKKNKFCTKCGNSMGATANFCNKCGTPVGAPPMQSAVPVLQRARG